METRKGTKPRHTISQYEKRVELVNPPPMTDTLQADPDKLDVEEMTHAELRDAWKKLSEKLRTPVSDPDEDVRLNVLKMEIWNEMKSRTDAEPPECPECGSQRWSQSFDDPKECGGCGLHLTTRHDSLIEEVDTYWQEVTSAEATA